MMSYQEITVPRPWIKYTVLAIVCAIGLGYICFYFEHTDKRFEKLKTKYETTISKKDLTINKLTKETAALRKEIDVLKATITIKDQVINSLTNRKVISIPGSATIKVESEETNSKEETAARE
jgi:hypothetical protein